MSPEVLQVLLVGLSALLAGALAGVAWLTTRTISLGERVVKLETDVEDVQKDVADQLTQECVRDVIESALARRDQAADERRLTWDENLSLKIEQAVFRGTKECQAQTRADLELIVPRIVREVLQQTDRHRKPVITAPDGRPA